MNVQEVYNTLGTRVCRRNGGMQDWAEWEFKWPCSLKGSPRVLNMGWLSRTVCFWSKPGSTQAAQWGALQSWRRIWEVCLSIHPHPHPTHIAKIHWRRWTWLAALILSIKGRKLTEKEKWDPSLGGGRAGRGWNGSDQVPPNKWAKAKVRPRWVTLCPLSGLPQMLSLLPDMFFTQSSGLCSHVTSSVLSPWGQSSILNFAFVISFPLWLVRGLFIQYGFPPLFYQEPHEGRLFFFYFLLYYGILMSIMAFLTHSRCSKNTFKLS